MPTSSSNSWARARAWPRPRSVWVVRTSAICFSTVATGFSELIGSWKIMPISLPRMSSMVSSLTGTMSRPLSWTAPPTMRAGGSGSRRMIESADSDLPQPDSPTSATVSPAPILSDRPSTAFISPRRVNSVVLRSFTSRGADGCISGPAASD